MLVSDPEMCFDDMFIKMVNCQPLGNVMSDEQSFVSSGW